jgi:histidinol-phosphate phosphatase family protein
MAVDLVIPSVGRPCLPRLLAALGEGEGPRLRSAIVVLDRPGTVPRPALDALATAADEVRVVRGRGAGPAAARNMGWRLARSPWIAFLDDDVVPEPAWRERLAADLEGLPGDVAASQGRIEVPLLAGRRPTDWERNVAGLAGARWATADMAYRRDALSALGGFDERFPRAYREDADLGLRATRAGRRIAAGGRRVAHPPGEAGPWISLRLQAGNADDVLMRALHGRRWRERAGAPRGRRARHLATTVSGAGAAVALLAGRRRRRLAALLGTAWLAGTAELAAARIAPGPRTFREVALMTVTSAAIPPLAAWHTLAGTLRRRRLLADRVRAPQPAPAAPRPSAVLLDRDGTLVEDVPYNGDPARVRPMPGAAEALGRLRREGVPTAVVSNQSGVARGLLTREEVAAVNRRVEAELGAIGPWMICTHGPDEGCGCRKPAPGLVRDAARELGVAPEACAVVGDIGADVEAARRAGARAVLVPTGRTLPAEVAGAPLVAPDLVAAVELLLGPPR